MLRVLHVKHLRELSWLACQSSAGAREGYVRRSDQKFLDVPNSYHP